MAAKKKKSSYIKAKRAVKKTKTARAAQAKPAPMPKPGPTPQQRQQAQQQAAQRAAQNAAAVAAARRNAAKVGGLANRAMAIKSAAEGYRQLSTPKPAPEIPSGAASAPRRQVRPAPRPQRKKRRRKVGI